MILKPPPSAALKAASRLQKLRASNTIDQQDHVGGENVNRGNIRLYIPSGALRSVHQHDVVMARSRYVYR